MNSNDFFIYEFICFKNSYDIMNSGVPRFQMFAEHVLVWEMGALTAASCPGFPLAVAESSESHVRSYRAICNRVGPNTAGRPLARRG